MTLQNTKSLKKQVAPFEKSTTKESLWQIINTVVPFITLWFLAYISLSVSYWLALVPIVDDCRIFSTNFYYLSMIARTIPFLKVAMPIELVGTAMGVLPLFPFDGWGMNMRSITQQAGT